MEGKQEQKKGLLGKLKDAAEDQEHQIQILGTFVRLGVVVWSGFIITMNYVELPMIKKAGNSDITFVASVFTGALATFGLSTGNNNKDKGTVNCPMVKKSGNSDITFVASVFTGALATFGLSTGNNNKDKGTVNCPMAKKKEE